MKLEKLFVTAAAGCLLVGASGIVVAQDSNCEGGIVNNRTVNNLTVTDQECFVSETIARGNVTVSNSPSFIMTNSTVAGTITITGGADDSVYIYDVEIFNNASVNGGSNVWWIDNSFIGEAANSNLTVENAEEAQFWYNRMNGNLTCSNNNSQFNFANLVFGEDTCLTDVNPPEE